MKKPVASVTEDLPTDLPAELDPALPTTLPAALPGALPRIDGRSARWTAHRAARRTELIDAAIKAVSRHGAGVGMDQIAAVANTSKPVIYRYFADKDDLYRAITQRVVGQVLRTLATVLERRPEPRELFHAGIDAYLGLLEANPELYRFVAQHPLVPADKSVEGARPTDFSAVVARMLGAQMEDHLCELGLPADFAHPWSECIVGFLDGATVWWLDHREAMTRAQLADYLSALLWGGAAGVYQQVGKAGRSDARAGGLPAG